MDTIRTESPASAALLNLCAYLAPDSIPRELLNEGKEYLPDELATIAEDDLAMDRVIATLKRYSLLTVEKDFLSIHRLVQVVIRSRLDSGDKEKRCEAAARIVNEAYPYDSDDVRTWDECSCLLPHAVASEGHAEECGVGLDAAGCLLNQIGHYIRGKAEFGRAKKLYERALIILEKFLGKDHERTLIVRRNLESLEE